MIKPIQTIKVGQRILDVSQPLVMGILNITNNSFYDGGKYLNRSDIITQVKKMIDEDVDIIDIGAMSSRPGAELIPTGIELQRIVEGIEIIKDLKEDMIISVDTWRKEVAAEAIKLGANIINDITAGLSDSELLQAVADLQIPYVLMHMQGNPQTMQHNPQYTHVVTEILDFFIRKIEQLRALGIYDIIIDPGFGFGKTAAHNYQILRDLQAFLILEYPIMVGISRKSMIYKELNIGPLDSLAGTNALHFAALQNGARILRVHDVKEAKQVIAVWKLFNQKSKIDNQN